MSNRLFQGVIYQMKDAFDRLIGVVDENGVVISCSDLSKMGELRQGVREELSFSNEFTMADGYTYRYMGTGSKSEYKTKYRILILVLLTRCGTTKPAVPINFVRIIAPTTTSSCGCISSPITEITIKNRLSKL